MKIEVDIDGVIRDFMGKLKEVYSREYPEHKLIREDIYDLSSWFPIEKEIYKFGFEIYATEIFSEAQIYLGVKEFLKKIYDNHKLVFISNQSNKNLEKLTVGWIKQNELPYHEIIFTKDKSIFKGDYLLDDYTENLKRVDEIKSSIPVCFDRPWNQDWKGQRIKSYNEFLEIINLKMLINVKE